MEAADLVLGSPPKVVEKVVENDGRDTAGGGGGGGGRVASWVRGVETKLLVCVLNLLVLWSNSLTGWWSNRLCALDD